MKFYLSFAIFFCCVKALAQTGSENHYGIDRVPERSEIVGQTKFNLDSFWSANVPETNHGQISYSKWQSIKDAGYVFYFAEVTDDPKENLATETGRDNKARFVPGYKMLVDANDGPGGFQAGFYFKHIEYGYYNGTLISMKMDIDTSYYKALTKYYAAPTSYTIKRDTVNLPNSVYKVILTTRVYTWLSGNNKAELRIAEELNKKGMKKKSATYQMTAINGYTAYMKQVGEEKKRLDKVYAQMKN